MGLDPNVLMQMLVQKRAREEQQGLLREKIEAERQERTREGLLSLVEMSKKLPELDPKKARELGPALGISEESFRAFDVLHQAQKKQQRAQQSAQQGMSGIAGTGGGITGPPGQGESLLGAGAVPESASPLGQVLDTLRAAQTQATGSATPSQQLDPASLAKLNQQGRFGAFQPETLGVLQQLDVGTQDLSRAERAGIIKAQAERVDAMAGDVDDLRKEYTRVSSTYEDALNATQTVLSLAKGRQTLASGTALVSSFARALEPGSRLTDEDIARAGRTGTLSEQAQAFWNQLAANQRFTPSQVQDIVDATMDAFKPRREAQEIVDREYKRIARKRGLPADDVVFVRRPVRPGKQRKPPEGLPNGVFIGKDPKTGNDLWRAEDGQVFEDAP